MSSAEAEPAPYDPERAADDEKTAEKAVANIERLIKEEANAPSRVSKKTKERVRSIVSAIHQTITVIESAAEYHPAAKVAVGIFKGVLQLEANRKDNNEQIVAVCHSMTRALLTFKYIPTHESARDEESELFRELTGVIDECRFTMVDFAGFADLYYTSFSRYRLVRFIRATDFKQKLTSYANRFDEHRKQLVSILSISGSVALVSISADIKRILERLGTPTNEAEERAAAEVERMGGPEQIRFADRQQVQNIGKMLGEGKAAVTSVTMAALTADIDKQVKTNHDLFVSKLASAQSEIVESVNRSTDLILKKLSDGPWELIQEDADIREIWQANKWTLGVKCRQFVDSIYTHYARYPRLQDPNNPVDDSWTLQVIAKVVNHPAIGEAIDEDASGFLSIHEVKHFLKKKPTIFTTPMWLVFWGIGWRYMNAEYTKFITPVLKSLATTAETLQKLLKAPEEGDDVEGEDASIFAEFLETAQQLKFLLKWIDINDTADGDDILADYDTQVAENIKDLARQISRMRDNTLQKNLETCAFRLDGASLSSVIGEPEVRIEIDFMPLLFLLLQRLHGMFSELTDPPELTTAFTIEVDTISCSIYELLVAFNDRMMSLLRSWRSQKLDTELQIECYAGGLMHGWWSRYENAGKEFNSFLYSDSEFDSDDDDDDEEVEEQSSSTRFDTLDNRLARIESTLERILAVLPSLVENADLHHNRALARHNDRSDPDHGNVPAPHVGYTRADDGEGMPAYHSQASPTVSGRTEGEMGAGYNSGDVGRGDAYGTENDSFAHHNDLSDPDYGNVPAPDVDESRADDGEGMRAYHSQASPTVPGGEMGTTYDSEDVGRGEVYTAESSNEASWAGRGNVGDETEGGYEDQRETGDRGNGGDEDGNENETARATWNSNEYDD